VHYLHTGDLLSWCEPSIMLSKKSEVDGVPLLVSLHVHLDLITVYVVISKACIILTCQTNSVNGYGDLLSGTMVDVPG
jgi:hypothetical protein